jgi:hypothetical protein
MISDQELTELKDRCKYAAAHGFQVALAGHIAAELEDEAGESDHAAKHSAEHLLSLVCMVEEVRSGQAKRKAKAPMAMDAKIEATAEVASDPFPTEKSKKSKKKDED